MEKKTLGQHTSQRFNRELDSVRSRVLAMGGLVEQQISQAVLALMTGDSDLADVVMKNDYQVNSMEVTIDEEVSYILARRQPAAIDLRMLVTVIKTITDLERVGDQAERVARMAKSLADAGVSGNQFIEIEHLGQQVQKMLQGALDAFARMDPEAAVEVARQDIRVDQEYELLMRQLITFMMEDPRTIGRTLNLIWAARALERIGDHSSNICEYVIYMVKGKDVRHTSLDQMEVEAKRQR